MHKVFSFFLDSFLEERDRWFLWAPVLMAGGSALYFSLNEEPSSQWLWAMPVVSLFVYSVRERVVLRTGALFLGVFVLGFNAAQLESRLLDGPMLESKTANVSMTGRLMRAEPLPLGGARLMVEDPIVEGMKQKDTPRLLRIKTAVSLEDLPEPGALISLWGPLWPPGEAVLPGAHDFRRTAFFKNIGGYGVSHGLARVPESTEIVGIRDRINFAFERARRALLRSCSRVLSGDEAAMTSALLTGNQTGMSDEILAAMRISGLFHLLSISGVHVSMFALLVYVPIRFFLALWPWIALRVPIKKIASFAAIPATAGYVLLVGAETPTLRSALMTILVMGAVIADRKALSLRMVALAAFPVVFFVPSAVVGPSFQMSFMAVLAMIAVYEKKLDFFITEGFSFASPGWVRAIARGLRDITMTSLVATAATAPMTIFHFQTFSFYGVISNIVALPLTSLWVMPNLLLTYLAAPFGEEEIFVKASGWGVRGIMAIAQEVASWPLAQIETSAMPQSAFLCGILGGLWLCLWRRSWRFLGVFPILVACSYPLWSVKPDLLVSAEAPSLWAVVRENGVLVSHGGKNKDFILTQWQRATGSKTVLSSGKAAKEGVVCVRDVCSYGPIALLSQDAGKEDVEAVCREKVLVVAFFEASHCGAPYVIDAVTLREKGAHAVFFGRNETMTLQSVRTHRGARPWSVGWPGFYNRS